MNKQTRTKSSLTTFAIAALSVSVVASSEIQLLPAGKFRATDGRPKDVEAWLIDAEAAAIIIKEIEGRDNRLVIDYEHQTLRTVENGQPAPAAGWFKKLEWREGDGLYAVDVEWTDRAKEFIESKEYLYISPVFSYDKKTGTVKRLINAALTNNPALDGMDEVAHIAASKLLDDLLDDQHGMESLTMDIEEILKQLRWMLNLPTLATPKDVLAELQKAADKIKESVGEEAAANFNLLAYLEKLGADLAAATSQVAALKEATPDPAKYVPIETMQALQAEIAQLRSDTVEDEVGDLITEALTAGKLLPAQEGWARELGKKDITALRTYIETAPKIAALTSTQTGGQKPTPGGNGGQNLTESELAICSQMGISPEEYKKAKESEPVAA